MAQKRKSGKSGDLFIEGSGQLRLVEKSAEQHALEKDKVECLGMTFDSDDERRAFYTERLREKLTDPEFRKADGFPNGSVEDILALSDPPYYTACPNPFIPLFLERASAFRRRSDAYFKEPFAADVSEGKNDPIYNLHSYHTKVPHKAIMRYMLHYTEPGDIVFDGFSGTGMTGVAAALCDELGSDRTVTSTDGRAGSRYAIVSDLAPICSFIAYNILKPLDRARFLAECTAVVRHTEAELRNIYETNHSGWRVRDRKKVAHKAYSHPGADVGIVDFTLYSDVVSCPECSHESSYYRIAVDEQADSLRKANHCPSCAASVREEKWLPSHELVFDPLLGTTTSRIKIEPVLINYTVGGTRFEKLPDPDDRSKSEAAAHALRTCALPLVKLIPGKETQRNAPRGIEYLHQFFTEREHAYLARLIQHAGQISDRRLALGVLFAITATMPYASRMRRFRADRKGGGPLSGTLYVGSLITPPHVGKSFLRNAETIADGLSRPIDPKSRVLVTTQSATNLRLIPDGSIDYIFTDPPFGHNFDYSELNFFWEAVLRVTTNQAKEAIVSASQAKGVDEYRALMSDAFSEFFRILKPGRWITVEFSNTMAGVWNSIQTALQQAGFVVASVSALDKKQMSFKAVMTPTAVKQDLVISAYKPNGGLEERFAKNPTVPERVWDFVATHLSHLPKPRISAGELQFVTERDPRILFDRMVSWFVQHGCPVPVSSRQFQEGLLQRFTERDGMIFLEDEAQDYERVRGRASAAPQLSLFVDDERTAISWLQHFLRNRPSKFQDIHPEFMKQLNVGWKKHEAAPELSQLLNQNFLMFRGDTEVPSQIHSYLSTNFKELRNLAKDDPALIAKAADRWYLPDPSKQIDLEKLREKTLLTEFETYKQSRERKLKLFRTEAVRVGFKVAYEAQDYKTIVAVAAKLPESVLQEDEKLLMYFDVASMRLGDE